MNARKQSFPVAAEDIMRRLQPFPPATTSTTDWPVDVCTPSRFAWALKKTGFDVGVGADGFPGYLVRKAPSSVQSAYLYLLHDILRQISFTPAWQEWYAILSMKPGENPRELGNAGTYGSCAIH